MRGIAERQVAPRGSAASHVEGVEIRFYGGKLGDFFPEGELLHPRADGAD